MKRFLAFAALLTCSFLGAARAEELSGQEIVRRMLVVDPWGFGGAEIAARLKLTDKNGSKSELQFASKSKQYDPPLNKGVIRFSAPSDLAGAAFLQVQKKEGDDERFLFLPELKRSRRIAGSLRNTSFMGTDFTFADLDRRDLRDGDAKVKGKENVGKFPCHVIDTTPKSRDSEYSHVEIWVREDNFIPLRMKLYDRKGSLMKTFEALETRRVDGTWFISKCRMQNHAQKHATELVLEKIAVKSNIPEDEFTVRALEKL